MLRTNWIPRFSLALAALLIACGEPSNVSAPPDSPLPVRAVDVQATSTQLIVGSTMQLTATPKDAAGRPLVRPTTWQSLSPSVATVSELGLVLAVAPGNVTIQASSEGVAGRATISIVAIPVHAVNVTPDTVTLETGANYLLSAVATDEHGVELPDREKQWTSLNPQVATVDAAGRLTAIAEGFAVVRATVEGVSAEARIFVRPIAVDRVVLSETSLELEIGDVAMLSARVLAASGAELTGRLVYWGSSEPSVVSVASNGRLEAHSSGTVTLTVASEGRETHATVKVDIPPTQSLIFDRTSPAGQQIFVRDRLGNLTRMNAGNVSSQPAPSPDGRRFAFVVVQIDQTTRELQHDLYVVDRDGLNIRWLTRMAGAESEPAWSPDGTKIAYAGSSSNGGDQDIYVVNVDGTNVVNLTPNTPMSIDLSPAWSPDGKTIAYASIAPVGGSHIYIMNADGSGRRRLDGGATLNARHPTWSPDGASIAWSRSIQGSTTGMDIVIANLAGVERSVLALPGDQVDAAWSADGRHFAYSEMVGGVWNVFTVRRDGAIARQRAIGGNPAWIRP